MHEIPSVTHDILNCLANLSNDEVFTPPELANKMIALLPSALFDSTQTTFLDPCCKSGVFLREIAKRLINSKAHKATFETTLPQNLSEEEKHQKRLDHIYHKQLYGIAITQLTALMSRRTLYCSKYPNTDYSISKFDDLAGNIRFVPIDHRWDKNGKCKYCGASQVNYSQEARGENRETHAYEFIHTDKPEELWGKMKFDVIIGNPPYQLETGQGQSQALPIYHKFIEQAIKLNPHYLSMIVPSRWFSGGMGLDAFRKLMLKDDRINRIVDYSLSSDCFPGVDIAGGVNYFLWNSAYNGECTYTYIDNNKHTTIKRNLNEFEILVRNNDAVKIIRKIQLKKETCISKIMSALGPFKLSTSERGIKSDIGDCYNLRSSEGHSFIQKKQIKSGKEYIDKWKVIIGKATSAGAATANKSDGKRKVIATLEILEPDSVCTFSYFIGGAFDTQVEARNCLSYLSTKFVRFLLLQYLSSINITKDRFSFVPLQDFSKPWTDAELYEKYGLSQEEIDFIESTIKPMA